MARQSAGADRQRHSRARLVRRAQLVRIQEQQRGGLSGLGGKLSGSPRVPQELGREPQLGLDARKRSRESLAEQNLDIA